MATAAPEAPETDAPPRRGSRLPLIIGAMVTLFLTVQVILFMVFMRPATSAESETKAEEAAAPVDDMAEVSIGTGFHCTNNRAAAGSTINVDFKLVALVPRSHAVTFKDALNAHDGRIREAIMRVIRGSSLDDLQDAHLSNIKRLIREEINKILAKDFVTEVVISEYTTFDQ